MLAVAPSVWQQVLNLYPALVECTTVSSAAVCLSLREALKEYGDLLHVPNSSTPNGV